MKLRVGQGYDIHAFCPGNAIVLGGVRIDFHQTFCAHSDGDVLLHAVCDALLGAVALGDIGQHFPDSDARFAGADSRELLRTVMQKVRARGYQLSNLDAVIIAEAPKLAPHIAAMRCNLAEDLNCALDCISIKATTHEKLGSLGEGRGIAALCTCLVYGQD